MDMIATRTTIGRGIFDDMVEAVEGGGGGGGGRRISIQCVRRDRRTGERTEVERGGRQSQEMQGECEF